MKSITAIIAPPLLCAGVLLGITIEKMGHVRPQDAEAYHERVRVAIEKMQWSIGDEQSGVWIGHEVKPTKAAVELLRPNVILSRRYSDDRGRSQSSRHCSVLIVHCKDSRDMVGHYPENCYRNIGETLLERRDRKWEIAGVPRPVIGTEYTFERFERGPAGARRVRKCVYNFLVVPTAQGMAIVPDIKRLNEAAEDYQKRYYGAAQFQFVMSDELSRDQRDRIFETLLGSNPEVFEALSSVEVK